MLNTKENRVMRKGSLGNTRGTTWRHVDYEGEHGDECGQPPRVQCVLHDPALLASDPLDFFLFDLFYFSYLVTWIMLPYARMLEKVRQMSKLIVFNQKKEERKAKLVKYPRNLQRTGWSKMRVGPPKAMAVMAMKKELMEVRKEIFM